MAKDPLRLSRSKWDSFIKCPKCFYLKEKHNNRYIYLISKLFNVYISEVKQDLLDFDFTVPEFFDKEKFKINTELISNKLTKDYIKESDKLEYIFKFIVVNNVHQSFMIIKKIFLSLIYLINLLSL